jgi:hypothetical protein
MPELTGRTSKTMDITFVHEQHLEGGAEKNYESRPTIPKGYPIKITNGAINTQSIVRVEKSSGSLGHTMNHSAGTPPESLQ